MCNQVQQPLVIKAWLKINLLPCFTDSPHLAGRMTQAQQDAVESQIGEGLKKCHQTIQQLQNYITVPSGTNPAQPIVNYATVAHRQGVVGCFPTISIQFTAYFLFHANCTAFHASGFRTYHWCRCAHVSNCHAGSDFERKSAECSRVVQ